MTDLQPNPKASCTTGASLQSTRDPRTKKCYLTWRFTLGSSSPLRGAATPAARRPVISSTAGHHRPYEGQQLPDKLRAGGYLGRTSHHRPYEGQQHRRSSPAKSYEHGHPSSSPLRGAATRRPPGTGRRRSHHRPYEGQQQVVVRPAVQVPSGHHRPYEGQQHDVANRHAAGDAGSSSPLRGAATLDAIGGDAPPAGVIIAPTRGSNPYMPRSTPVDAVIIAPTRGSNMIDESGSRSVTGSSSPLRGAATSSVDWRGDAGGGVIIAPTRGSNLSTPVSLDLESPVIIAPTRGSNTLARRAAPRAPGHHRPYEGQQHRGADGGAGGPRHHRPYEGQQH